MTTQQLREEIMTLDKLRQSHQIDNPEYFDDIMAKVQEYVAGVIGEDEELNVPEDMAGTARLNVQIMLNYRDTLRAEQRRRAGLE